MSTFPTGITSTPTPYEPQRPGGQSTATDYPSTGRISTCTKLRNKYTLLGVLTGTPGAVIGGCMAAGAIGGSVGAGIGLIAGSVLFGLSIGAYGYFRRNSMGTATPLIAHSGPESAYDDLESQVVSTGSNLAATSRGGAESARYASDYDFESQVVATSSDPAAISHGGAERARYVSESEVVSTNSNPAAIEAQAKWMPKITRMAAAYSNDGVTPGSILRAIKDVCKNKNHHHDLGGGYNQLQVHVTRPDGEPKEYVLVGNNSEASPSGESIQYGTAGCKIPSLNIPINEAALLVS